MKVFRFEGKPGNNYFEVLWYIVNSGQVYEDERGMKYIEAEPITIEVVKPVWDVPERVLPEYIVQRYGSMFIIDYADRLVGGKAELGDYVYSYGERLHRAGQLHKAIEKLKEHRWTRRATITIRVPEDIELDDAPCMTVVDFKIRQDGLRLTALFRSHDMENGWPINYYGLLVLGQYVAEQVGVTLARITTISLSAHVYLWRGR